MRVSVCAHTKYVPPHAYFFITLWNKYILSFIWNAFEVTATCNRPETQASRTPPALACLSAPPKKCEPSLRVFRQNRPKAHRHCWKPLSPTSAWGVLGVFLTAAGAGCGRWPWRCRNTNWPWEHKNGLACYLEEPAKDLLRENAKYCTHHSVGTKRILTFDFIFKGLFFIKVFSQRKDHLTWVLCLPSHEGYSHLGEYCLFRFLSLKKKGFSGNIYFVSS